MPTDLEVDMEEAFIFGQCALLCGSFENPMGGRHPLVVWAWELGLREAEYVAVEKVLASKCRTR